MDDLTIKMNADLLPLLTEWNFQWVAIRIRNSKNSKMPISLCSTHFRSLKALKNDFLSRCKVNDFDTIMILNKYMYTHDKHRRHHYTRSKRLVALLEEEQTLTLLALYG